MTLYVFYHCNEWHEYSSFRFIGVVDESAYDNAIRNIKQATGYTNEEMKRYIHIQTVYLNDLDI